MKTRVIKPSTRSRKLPLLCATLQEATRTCPTGQTLHLYLCLITIWYLASSIIGSLSSTCQLHEALLHLSLFPRLSHLPPITPAPPKTLCAKPPAGSEPAGRLQLPEIELDLLLPEQGPVCCRGPDRFIFIIFNPEIFSSHLSSSPVAEAAGLGKRATFQLISYTEKPGPCSCPISLT